MTAPGPDQTAESRALAVLFVCTANICRSAFAERMARHLVGDDPSVHVTSAGTHGRIDDPVDPELEAELHQRGIEAGDFASRRLTMDMVDAADLVLTASMAHRQFILDDRPAAVWRVYTLGQFARTIAGIPDDVRGFDLLRACRRAHKPARPDDDVADPFNQGPEAAATAAKHIERLLAEVMPRLTTPAVER